MRGDDIGGFAGHGPRPELLTRWIEIGAFKPIFRDHAQKGKDAQERGSTTREGGAFGGAISKNAIG